MSLFLPAIWAVPMPSHLDRGLMRSHTQRRDSILIEKLTEASIMPLNVLVIIG